MRYNPYAKYGRAAYGAVRLARGIYANRKYVKAASKIARAWRRKRNRRTVRRGHRVTNEPKQACAQREFRGINFSFPSLSLVGENVFFNAQGDLHRQRKSQVIFVKGIKICFQMHRLLTDPGSVARNWVVHFALVRSKDKDPTLTDFLTRVRPTFFRDMTADGTNTSAFDEGGNIVYDMKYNCNPINPANMDILTRSKRILHADIDEHRAADKHYWTYEKYIKINKRVEFEQNGSVVPKHAFHMLWWCAPLNQNDFIGTDLINRMEVTTRTITYWKNLN